MTTGTINKLVDALSGKPTIDCIVLRNHTIYVICDDPDENTLNDVADKLPEDIPVNVVASFTSNADRLKEMGEILYARGE